MKKNIFYSIIFILLSFSNLLAVDSQIVTGKNGKDLFNFKFFDKGEEAEDFNGSKISTYTLNSEEKKAVLDAGKYWSEVLNTDNALLSTINVYTLNDANAYATSITVEKGDAKGMMELQAKILGKSFNPHLGEAVATIGIGIMGFKTGAPSNLPNAEGVNLYGTIVHEIAHTLGIMSTANFYEDEKFRFGDVLSNFDKGLIDNNDRKISDTTGISYIDNNGNLIGNPETDFDASANVYFVGKNVDEVLKDSSLEGVPVNVGLEGYYDELPPAPELSHLEMDRGLMSHQQYRSYTTFMEAELAVLQDIGYTIDRRNFFGYSVYGNDSTIDNYNGYFLRDEKGEKYITGKYNTASYGVGLHVYGSRNNIVQKADLLTSGIAGIGIRIDGVGNKITVDRGIKVNADGDYGTGILVAYGKEHNITNNGEIKARGNQGIGVRFDFGSNTLGKDWAYMGSYILFLSKEDCSKPENLEYAEINGLKLGEINGALVENFNTSGYIEGKYASLYMSENAYVKNINVFDGAVLKGNIISMYKPKMEFGNNTITTETNLNLGLDKNDTSKGDSNFSFKFDDNIIGKNIVLNMAGGTSSLNGQNEILRVVVKDGAVLKGNARYILEENGSFVNKGTVAPGNSIGKMIIEGNYSQEDNGKLNIEFDGNGNHDVLEIVGNASFSSGSSMTMTPLKSYYSESMKIDKDQFLIVTGTQNGNIDNLTFDDKIFASSSTIKKVDFDFLTSKMTVLREENPYSRFSENRNAENFAKAIDRISNQASGSIKDFIGALDFASPSVVSSALSQAAPNIYGNNIIATFESEKEHSDYIRNHLLAEKNHEKNKSYAFGKLFYRENWQKGTRYLMGYDYRDQGVITGIEKEYNEGLILGTHLLYSQSVLKGHAVNTPKIKSKNILLGVHGKYYLNYANTSYLYGMIRGGVQDNKLTNNIEFNEYRNNTNSHWKALTASSVLGIGKDIEYKNFTVTPLIELGYSILKPEKAKEDNLGINIDSKIYHSVYSKVGGKLSSNKILIGENTKVNGNILMAYNHDYINSYHIDGDIAQNRNSNFRIKSKRPDKDYVTIQGGTTFTVRDNLDVTLEVGTDLFRQKSSSVNTSLTFEWKF
ncbi:autotransporter outer membrane beta-barrel domain-containing protein [Fusobacterium varium]|uniref:autotransporter outer membrane beta-barrel domain-containing protein n=1 Tax=Fusobacterium varium TaxID=856 RepID=UPI0024327B42|nr:autotransporter outer membrane beta-barrel domain-containing protein [Fusobacterium varium]MCF0169305.1 autotransporter outer membrane beta-barrel domain-containing protein [Fusobacterium varium]